MRIRCLDVRQCKYVMQHICDTRMNSERLLICIYFVVCFIMFCYENDMMLDSVYCICKAYVRQLANNICKADVRQLANNE
jgi:hypothetical protein